MGKRRNSLAVYCNATVPLDKVGVTSKLTGFEQKKRSKRASQKGRISRSLGLRS
jgi:hypothetical protein